MISFVITYYRKEGEFSYVFSPRGARLDFANEQEGLALLKTYLDEQCKLEMACGRIGMELDKIPASAKNAVMSALDAQFREEYEKHCGKCHPDAVIHIGEVILLKQINGLRDPNRCVWREWPRHYSAFLASAYGAAGGTELIEELS